MLTAAGAAGAVLAALIAEGGGSTASVAAGALASRRILQPATSMAGPRDAAVTLPSRPSDGGCPYLPGMRQRRFMAMVVEPRIRT